MSGTKPGLFPLLKGGTLSRRDPLNCFHNSTILKEGCMYVE